MFGYGSRNVSFKIAREKNAHVQILEFRKDFWKDTKVESLLEALDFEEDAQHNDHRHGAAQRRRVRAEAGRGAERDGGGEGAAHG
jgi:hypothetical protein